MQRLTSEGRQKLADIAHRHGFGIEGVRHMMEALLHGNGSMAQFSHPDFGGSGQWMRGGMTMVSDMFNAPLKSRVDALCSELASLLSSEPGIVQDGSFQSQRQGTSRAGSSPVGDTSAPALPDASGRLFEAPAPGDAGATWWPAELGRPDSAGSQNDARYAWFAAAHRLAIEVDGRVTVYDTADHRIGGYSQQQSGRGTMRFTSQHGTIDLASLDVLSSTASTQPAGAPPPARAVATGAPAVSPAATAPEPQATTPGAPASSSQDVFAAIERLAELRAKGVLNEDEFTSKKAELLRRI